MKSLQSEAISSQIRKHLASSAASPPLTRHKLDILARYCDLLQTSIQSIQCILLFQSLHADVDDDHEDCQCDQKLNVSVGDLLLVAEGKFYQVNTQFTLKSMCLNLTTAYGMLVDEDGQTYGIPLYGTGSPTTPTKQMIASALRFVSYESAKEIQQTLVDNTAFMKTGEGGIFYGRCNTNPAETHLYWDVNITAGKQRSMLLKDLKLEQILSSV